MTKQEAIKKYNLIQYKSKETYFELWQNTIEDDEKTTFYNLDNQMSVDLQDSNIFYLTTQIIYKNKFITDRKTGDLVNKTTTKVIEIINKGE